VRGGSANYMDLRDTNRIRGHLQVIRRDVSTKEETIVFDDHNVITSGMGATISNVMTMSPCDFSKGCESQYSPEGESSVSMGCRAEPYHITIMQLGTSGSLDREVASTALLGLPLTKKQYGGDEATLLEYRQLSPGINGSALDGQTFVNIMEQLAIGDFNLLSYLVLDETACNGVTLNEVGLFSQDPYLASKGAIDDNNVPHMIAYRKFSPILKDSSFELIIRWNIFFDTDCNLW